VVVALRAFPYLTLRRSAVVCVACLTTVALGVGLILAAPRYHLPLAVLPLAVGVPAWLACTRRTGAALAVVLVYLGAVDGVVKLRSGGQVATLGRDVLLYAVAIGMAFRARRPLHWPALSAAVLGWTVIVVAQLANPGNTSLSHAVASLRQDLEFVPLFFIGYAVLRTHRSLHAFFALLLALAALNGAVGTYQSTLTPQQMASWGPGYSRLVNSADARLYETSQGQKRVRPPALGSDEGFGGNLGATALPGGIVLLMAYWRRRAGLALALIVLGLVGAAAGVLSSQSRSSVIMALVGILALLGLIAVGRHAGRAIMALIVVGALAAAAVTVLGSYNSQSFDRYGTIAPGSAASTLYDSRASTWSLTPRYMATIPFGAGLGQVGPAAKGAQSNWNAESEFNFLIVETGVPGLLVLIAFVLALFRTILTGLRRERDPQAALLIAALAAPLFAYVVTWLVGVYTTAPPTAPYLWFSAGVISWWLVIRQRAAAPRQSAPGPSIVVYASSTDAAEALHV
jgi:hypothetical protein